MGSSSVGRINAVLQRYRKDDYRTATIRGARGAFGRVNAAAIAPVDVVGAIGGVGAIDSACANTAA
jgi:hypothetical protein